MPNSALLPPLVTYLPEPLRTTIAHIVHALPHPPSQTQDLFTVTSELVRDLRALHFIGEPPLVEFMMLYFTLFVLVDESKPSVI